MASRALSALRAALGERLSARPRSACCGRRADAALPCTPRGPDIAAGDHAKPAACSAVHSRSTAVASRKCIVFASLPPDRSYICHYVSPLLYCTVSSEAMQAMRRATAQSRPLRAVLQAGRQAAGARAMRWAVAR